MRALGDGKMNPDCENDEAIALTFDTMAQWQKYGSREFRNGNMIYHFFLFLFKLMDVTIHSLKKGTHKTGKKTIVTQTLL